LSANDLETILKRSTVRVAAVGVGRIDAVAAVRAAMAFPKTASR
jgi:hypothetical protein